MLIKKLKSVRFADIVVKKGSPVVAGLQKEKSKTSVIPEHPVDTGSESKTLTRSKQPVVTGPRITAQIKSEQKSPSILEQKTLVVLEQRKSKTSVGLEQPVDTGKRETLVKPKHKRDSKTSDTLKQQPTTQVELMSPERPEPFPALWMLSRLKEKAAEAGVRILRLWTHKHELGEATTEMVQLILNAPQSRL
jgi:hypothetical protein